MEKNISKKELKTLLNDSIQDAIGHLELPKPTKKVRKLLDKSSKQLAYAFARILKKENRKAKKVEKALAYADQALKGKKKKKHKEDNLQAVATV